MKTEITMNQKEVQEIVKNHLKNEGYKVLKQVIDICPGGQDGPMYSPGSAHFKFEVEK